MHHTHRAIPSLLVLLIATAAASGCAAPHRAGHPPRPARICHIVFISLNDSSRADALIDDCDRLLPAIPGVVSYACGKHISTGRATVDAAYDVGLYIGFDSTEAYATYVDHPNHVELVNTWRPEIKTMLVRDVEDRAG